MTTERVRLLGLCGRLDEALQSVPDGDLDKEWKAELMLTTGHGELVKTLEPFENDSVMTKVITELLSTDSELEWKGDLDAQETAELLQKQPWHSNAVQMAAQLVEQEDPIPIAELIIQENKPPLQWPQSTGDSFDETWLISSNAVLHREGDAPGNRSKLFLEWAERCADLTMRAILTSVGARFKEMEEGSSQTVLDLFKAVEEMDPGQLRSGESVLRLLRQQKAWSQLAVRLADEASVSEDETTARIALHERALILEYTLKNLDDAFDAVSEILSYDPGDLAATWSSVRLAFSRGDWQLLARELDSLASLIPEDAPLFHLLSGEVNLFALGSVSDALSHFESASESEDMALAQTARLYSICALYQLGETQALEHAVSAEFDNAPDHLKALWLPETLEAKRSVYGTIHVAEMLDQLDTTDTFKLLWQLISGLNPSDSTTVQSSLFQLADLAPPGNLAGAFRTAAFLLKGKKRETIVESDLDSNEALWHIADRLDRCDDPQLRTRICKTKADITTDEDELQAVEVAMNRAEALEDAGNLDGALTTLRSALEQHPSHPGLLEELLHIAIAAEKWAEAADTHGRLASYYDSEEEKAYNLAAAAMILFDKLWDDKGAQNICEEALRRVPDHPEANEVLIRILKSRGDEESIASLLEKRIGVESNKDELLTLYVEQADQMLALEDNDGALRAIDDLLSLAPERLSAYQTKIDILTEMENWKAVIATMREYIANEKDPVGVRTMTWHAADVIADQLGEPSVALSWLTGLMEEGDRHPETERRIVEIATRSEQWDMAVNALSRLANLITDDEPKRLAAKREEAQIRLEQLFDEDAAIRIVDDILKTNAADLPTLKFSSQFLDPERSKSAIARAVISAREKAQANPSDVSTLETLRELATLIGNDDLVTTCDDCLAFLRSEEPSSSVGEYIPSYKLNEETLYRIFTHEGEINPAARVAELAAELSPILLSGNTHLPIVNRGTRINPKSGDPILDWTFAWTNFLEQKKIEVHRVADSSKDAVPIPGVVPVIAISPHVQSPLSARHRFLLARNLWRAIKGMGGFREGDMAGPVRWVIAVATAVLGERAEFPQSADASTVNKIKKEMSRKLKKNLTESCTLLLQESRQSLRTWNESTSFSADRFGLLATDSIADVLRLVIEESAGSKGIEKLSENPAGIVHKIPRCREIIKFALSEDYQEARMAIGIKKLGKGAN